MKIVSLTVTHNRNEITKDTLLQLTKLRLEGAVLVGTTASDSRAAERIGAVYAQYHNHPLGAKWQVGLYKVREFNPDAVLICGSDDWLTSNWCSVCAPYVKKGYDLVGKTICYMCRARPDKPLKLVRFAYTHPEPPIGAGRLISRNILDKLNWQLFPIDAERGLDSWCWYNMREVNGSYTLVNHREDAWLLCIKSTWETLSSWNRLMKYCKEDPSYAPVVPVKEPIEWINKHFPGSPIRKYLRKR